jgi:carbonic anhydrase/acetyltransferase-like protein (isoleucine patch superfamily)
VIHPSSFIARGAVVLGDVSIGAGSSVWYNAVLRGDVAPISVGEQTNIQDLTMIHVDVDMPCRVGNRVGVGHRAILHGCTIEDECLIGMGAILLNRVFVGTGSVIGAGAVLAEGMEVPPRSLVLGIPGRVVRAVKPELTQRIQNNWQHYVELAEQHRTGSFRPPPNPGVAVG